MDNNALGKAVNKVSNLVSRVSDAGKDDTKPRSLSEKTRRKKNSKSARIRAATDVRKSRSSKDKIANDGKKKAKSLSRRSILSPQDLESNHAPSRSIDSRASSGDRLRMLRKTASVRNEIGQQFNVAVEKASEMGSVAVNLATGAAKSANSAKQVIKKRVSEKILKRNSVDGKLEPHPTKGLLRKGNEVEFHLLHWMNLADHYDVVTDIAFSPNGLFMATSGGPEDRNIILTYRNTLSLGPALARRTTLHLADDDFATSFSFTPNSSHLLCALGRRKSVQVYQLSRRPDAAPQLEIQFQTHHKYPINTVLMRDYTVPYILTCADDGDNFLKFWSREGKMMYSYETDEVSNRKVVASHDGKVVAVVAHLGTKVNMYKLHRGEKGRFKKGLTITDLDPFASLDGTGEETIRDVKIMQDDGTAYISGECGTWGKYCIDTQGLMAPAKLSEYEGPEPDRFLAIDATVDGSIVVCSRGQDLLFYRGTSERGGAFGSVLSTVENAHDSEIVKVIISPESDCVMTMGVDSTHARLWSMPRI